MTLTLIALGLIVGFIPLYSEICTKDEYTGNKDCADHNIIYVALWVTTKSLNEISAIISALATLVIAGFTITLAKVGHAQHRALEKTVEIYERQTKIQGLQTEIIEKQHAVGRLQFIATHRPRLIVRDVAMAFDLSDDGTAIISVWVMNTGGTSATVINGGATTQIATAPLPWPRIGAEATGFMRGLALSEGRYYEEIIASRETEQTIADWSRVEGMRFWLLGFLLYQDGGGAIRETRFARAYNPTTRRFEAADDPDYERQD